MGGEGRTQGERRGDKDRGEKSSGGGRRPGESKGGLKKG